MISSMTGFGQGAAEIAGIAYTVEIKTVNNRYFKPYLRLPDIAAFVQTPVEQMLRKRIYRGSVNYSLRMKNVSDKPLFEVDEIAMQGYISKLRRIAESNTVECSIDLTGLLTLPGVVQSIEPDEQQAEQIKQAVLDLTDKAVEQLVEMRLQEGKALAGDLIANCKIISQKTEGIRGRSPMVLEDYHNKLRIRVQQLQGQVEVNVAEEMLAREVAIFADRSDISEELVRLDSHLQQFESLCVDSQQVGRKLDFISQELLREANTIASKAADVEIIQAVIDIKCAIDRIKEQVQNIE